MPEIGKEKCRETAFALYVLPEMDVLARVAFSITRNGAEAEKLVQETLLCAFRGIERFDGAHSRAWLLTIMRNTEAKRYRRRRPHSLRRSVEVERREVVDPRRAMDSPEHIIMNREFEATVAARLIALLNWYRQVVELVDIDGLSYAEAAIAIGVCVGTVMSRLQGAPRGLRLRLSATARPPKRSFL